MLIVMAGGGTGGHVMPLLAVAEELRRRGHECLFIGTQRGMEAGLAPKNGFEIVWIEIGGFNRVGPAQALKSLVQLPAAVLSCRSLMKERRAAAVFSLGGYVAGPVVLAAAACGVPLVAMEPNAIPGLVSRKMARFVKRALVSFEETLRFFPPGRGEITGLPVRAPFFDMPWERPDGEFRVLVTGGSRGSRTLNKAASECFPLLKNVPVRIMVQTGREEQEEVARALSASGATGKVEAFIDDMPAAYREAHLVVSRSGAGAVSELAAAGRPSILVPFPFAADDHQRHNAEAMVRAGAAEMVADNEMTGQRMFELIQKLGAQPDRLESMSRAARGMARAGAAERAANVVEECARKR